MNLITHPNFTSHHIPARQVEIWLPPGYATSTNESYPVLYMHDGQNLFNPATATHAITWGIDEALTHLIAAGEVPAPIVVGIWHGEKRRWQEYLPQRPFASPAGRPLLAQNQDKLNGPIASDAYLRFLIEELKPFIDQRYRTRPEQAHTTIMGSSMGGLISLYALCEYPEVFSAAGCLSTHWPAVDGVILDYLREYLPAPGRHRLYFDYGTRTLDAQYEPHQRKVDQVMGERGYTSGKNRLTRRFDGADHSEKSWRERVHIPLKFLLSTGTASK